MDTLENLTDNQIDDFLSGRSSLTLRVAVGAHTMRVQLQLSVQDMRKLQESMLSPSDRGADSKAVNLTSDRKENTESKCSRSSIRSQPLHPALPSTSQEVEVPNLSYNTTSTKALPTSASSGFSCFPHPGFLPKADSPLCSAGGSSCDPRPLSPTPAATVSECDVNAEVPQQTGAVIKSIVKDSTGVFSGTFSGTVAPCNHRSNNYPRPGISIILQILNDLVVAAFHHQGSLTPSPSSQPSHSSHTVSQLAEEKTSKGNTKNVSVQSIGGCVNKDRLLSTVPRKNKTTHKPKSAILLMHQRTLCRKTCKASHRTPGWHSHCNRHL